MGEDAILIMAREVEGRCLRDMWANSDCKLVGQA